MKKERRNRLRADWADVGADALGRFLDAVRSVETVSGLTHSFYRYPARFSPEFARAAIELFTQPGDTVFDPFMGGGTTLVEACGAGRNAIGTDISSLAVFVSQVKTTPLSDSDTAVIWKWAEALPAALKLNNASTPPTRWLSEGYLRNITGRETWRIRKSIELSLSALGGLPTDRQRRFSRCAVLRTGQWALDCRLRIPTAAEFRAKLTTNIEEMLKQVKLFRTTAANQRQSAGLRPPLCLHRSAAGIENDRRVAHCARPKLILTSPPYPGVHVLYHRWQVKGRRETPAPFWIANCQDGHPSSFYTFGDRKQQSLTGYFCQLEATYASIAQLMCRQSVLVQMVAFSDPSWQLEKYLAIMKKAGLVEIRHKMLQNDSANRLSRHVPNRKWYADQKGKTSGSKEVVLLHQLA